ncbi:acyltransferase [Mycobacterium intracellulare]|uniref:acyltransferase family protein n=1 Tax=Mycobacterium avium complex (MAC) TaxID=120793 RepID=UPI0003555B31|nr:MULTISPECIES: acyltransferase [Mycobacterium avium complex (MAC)]AGP65858.1 putative acyltransferase [Mycobacterium intracellulare subsp. yongonense 05-1390]MBZ4612681.1 acyltransferase [Mycobacterium avium subsp. hominissuis]OBH67544.1 acyltransferase [Mycobacterium intracellulare]
MKLGQVFDPRKNALNALRLALAAEVMLFHSWPITGHMPPKSTLQLFFSVGVDGFFAISGFLITRSWISDPRLRDYLAARALRILPGFYICLIATAFVFAPLSVAIQGGSAAKLLGSTAPLEYVVKNAAVAYLQVDVGGTPRFVPGGPTWNGSLWSLIWELLCYLAVAVIGVAGLANRRWISAVILALATGLALILPPLTFPGVWTIPQLAVRAAIMFSAGAVMYQWRDLIPARWSLVAISLVIVAGAGFLPDYRVVGALPLAYAVIVSGALLKNDRLRLRTDLSYGLYIYAFPTQQLLAVCGLATRLHPAVFFLVAVAASLPLAAASWFLVEKPSMSLKRRLKQRWSAPVTSSSEEPPPASKADVIGDRPGPGLSETA